MEKELSELRGRCRQLDQFMEDHPSLWEHSVIRRFIKDPHRRLLLAAAVCTPTKKNRELLNQAFYSFYGEAKLTSYIIKTLHWRAVRYDQKKQQTTFRQPLILDQPAGGEQAGSRRDSIVSMDTLHMEEDMLEQSLDLRHSITHPSLYRAFNHLTHHQEAILQKKYKEGWSDTEIAKEWHVSQQAVYKTRQAALDKLRTYLKRGECE
ncbi:sigma-70 family RNA polymerase sigma factor [Salibacterium aidingense]|uniref:sigma-70 family RNA polymerase sigma factor n=1 Tax=Salibacterium aidingense TaxID=384933 RepID=UPI003BC1078A